MKSVKLHTLLPLSLYSVHYWKSNDMACCRPPL